MSILDHSQYSHGLEEIYQLEAVDIKSVRPISQPQQQVEEVVEYHFQEPEIDFDLGAPFRHWIAPFFLKEPIRTLSLSPNAEESLENLGMYQIQDLIGADLQGIGQGHIDEVEKKLAKAVQGRSLERCYELDCKSWLRSLLHDIEPKQARGHLEKFNLGHLFPLSKTEEFDLRKGRIETELNPKIKERVNRQCKAITEAFIIPWMRERQGLALTRQLTERLTQVAVDPKSVQPTINFLSEIEGAYPFASHLHQVEESLYCSDPHIAELFTLCIAKAKSYFYKPTVSYPLQALEPFLEREFAQEWQSFPEGFISKALKLSSHFRTRRGEAGHIVVKLA